MVWNRTFDYILAKFLNLSPLNAKLTLLSHVTPQTVMCLNVRRMAYAKVTVDLQKSSIKLRHTR